MSQWQGGETFWYHLDALGSTIALTDESGKVRNKYGYDEYGNPLSGGAEEIFNRYTFTGQPWDAAVGLYYYKARYYNPAIGRFLTQDTWKDSPWQPWTQNLYTYAGNNPINFTDPTGHRPVAENEEEQKQLEADYYKDKEEEAKRPPLPKLDLGAYQAASGKERLEMLMPYFLESGRISGVPWILTAAQWIHETGWGNSIPIDVVTGQVSFNLFGVKGVGTAGSVTDRGWEIINGKRVDLDIVWAAYNDSVETITAHAELLLKPWYSAAHGCGGDAVCWLDAIAPVYATDPEYSHKVKAIMRSQGWIPSTKGR